MPGEPPDVGTSPPGMLGGVNETSTESSTVANIAPEIVSLDIEQLPSLVGRRLGPSRAVTITQDRLDTFADATGDHQWIHTDPERAATGPFKRTIAHGYLTLSMASGLLFELLEVRGATQVVNYGADRVRFPAPLPVDERVRLIAECVAVQDVPGGHQLVMGLTFTREGHDKPVCVAEILFRYYGAAQARLSAAGAPVAVPAADAQV